MFCPNCGKKVEGGKFCIHCGQKLPVEVKLETAMTQEVEEVSVKNMQKEEEPLVEKRQEKPVRTVEKEETPVKSAERTQEIPEETTTQKMDNKQENFYDYRNLETKKSSGIRSIYILDFLIRLFQKRNIPTAIYLLINIGLIGLFATLFFQMETKWGMLVGLLVYCGSVTIALSPIGEVLLRSQTGCVKIGEAELLLRLEPLFAEVYYKAKKQHPELPGNIRMFMIEDESPNAFATGKRTVCVTRGLLNLSDEEIKGVLGHEFGHLVHQDTDRILVVTIGNTIISAIAMVFQGIALFIKFISLIIGIFAGGSRSDEGFVAAICGMIYGAIMAVFVQGFIKVWTKLGVLLCMKTSRDCEYEADAFAARLGYGQALALVLSQFRGQAPQGLMANLAKSHPDNQSRIYRLQQMDV